MRKLIVKGGTIEQEYPLIDTTIIGRASSSTIRLDGSKVADEHAKISKTGPNIFVEDLDTPHGITVNGKKVARWALKKGDLIGVGAITLLYDEDDKPDPQPKPKAPPIPEGQKTATNITPVKSSAPKNASKANVSAVNGKSSASIPVANGKSSASLPVANGKSSATLPLANGKSAANLPAAKAQDSARSVDAAKAKDAGDPRAEEPKSAEPKAAEPKPVTPKPAEPRSSQSSQLTHEVKSSAAISAALGKSSSSGRNSSAKSSQALSAVAGPGNLNAGNSSRINISPSKSIGGNSAVALSAAGLSSGKSGVMNAATAKLRLSGTMQAVGGGNDSSTRLGAASTAALIAQRMAHAPSGTSGPQPQASNLPASKYLLIAVGVLCFLVLILGGVLVATLMRGNGPTTDEKAALNRLHAKGAKASEDLQIAMPRLRAVRSISDVQNILGEPDVKLSGDIPLWDPQMGTTHYAGQAFLAYYISDQGAPSAIEEAPVVNVLLFLVTDSKVEFMGPKKYARFPQGPDKKVETEAANAPGASTDNPNPATVNNTPLPAPVQNMPTPPPPLPLADDKSPAGDAPKH